jgi:uncharacterized protein (DUF1015 family)
MVKVRSFKGYLPK